MQLEAEITKLIEYVDRNEDPLVQIVRMHEHNNNSAMLQTGTCIKRELKRGTRHVRTA